MEEKKLTTHSDWFNANYKGETVQAKELAGVLKKRTTARTAVDYIPWGIAVRMASQQDPDFSYEKQRNDDPNSPFYGTLLWYNGRPEQDDPNYFVKVKTTFFGRTVIEEYPCQDYNFEPVNFIGKKTVTASGKANEIKLDGNTTNKALQRALTKSICINTGLGLALYEGLDLQFEEDGVPDTPTPAPAKPAAKPTEAKPDKLTQEQLEQITQLCTNPEHLVRVNKAMASFKVDKINDFTQPQAATIIKALGGGK